MSSRLAALKQVSLLCVRLHLACEPLPDPFVGKSRQQRFCWRNQWNPRPKPEVVCFEVELVRDSFVFVHWNPGTFSGHEARFVVVARVDWLSSLQARLLPALWSVETAHVSYWLGTQVWLSTLSELVYPVVAFVSALPMEAKHNHRLPSAQGALFCWR